MTFKSGPRDEKGWRIPRDGTFAKKVYDLLRAGKSREDVSRALGHAAFQAMASITNPGTVKTYNQRAYHKRRDAWCWLCQKQGKKTTSAFRIVYSDGDSVAFCTRHIDGFREHGKRDGYTIETVDT